ncbi:Ribosome maturation protein SDO1 [Kluyveromyces marxianus]|nr:guanine nucleotide exchange factor sdo1 [Kluyveromyces marxianus]KAG0683362.1 guanine nucleotide exchange factor sdo1 [Kluyveromyces marxianus]BAP71009.1 ribosome maturation protein SDO1 [Kluyveromyces marxianus]
MAVINQPSGQIKLTNVSMVRLKKAKKRFEVACYQNKVQDYRNGVEKDLDEVLQINQVFLNVSKGQVASKEDLQKAFQTTDVDAVIKEIISKGEIQLSEKERQLQLNKINNEMLTIISAKCINPNSKKRYPPTMIHKALLELKFNVVVNKPAKLQALEAIKLLVSKQIIPIVRSKMKIKVDVSLKTQGSTELIEQLNNIIKSADVNKSETSYSIVGLIDPVAYRELVNMCNGKATLQVLDMAVIEDTK